MSLSGPKFSRDLSARFARLGMTLGLGRLRMTLGAARRRGIGGAGFSLMEVLMVSVLLPIVAFAIFSNFSSGMRLWQTLGTQDPNEDRSIFFQKVERDLEQSFRMEDLPFAGTPQEFELPTLIDAPEALGGSRAIGKAVYKYDPSQGALIRTTFNVYELAREKAGTATRLFGGIASFHASYLVWDKEQQRYGWVDEVDASKKAFPGAIKMDMEVQTHLGAELVARIFYVPTGD